MDDRKVGKSVFGEDHGDEKPLAARVRGENGGFRKAAGRNVRGAAAEGHPFAGARLVAPAQRNGNGVERDRVAERREEAEAVAGRQRLGIEREALKRETDDASKRRLGDLEKELAELNERKSALKARWEREQELIGQIRAANEELAALGMEDRLTLRDFILTAGQSPAAAVARPPRA